MVPQPVRGSERGGERRGAGPCGAPRSTPPVHRDLRGPGRAAGRRAAAARPAAVAAAGVGPGRPPKVDRLSCVRFGSARYSVPCRLIGQHGHHRPPPTTDDHDRSSRSPARCSPSTGWSRRVRPASSTTTTAAPAGRPARRAPRARTQRRRLPRPRPGRGGVPGRAPPRPGCPSWPPSWPRSCTLQAAHGTAALLAALRRAVGVRPLAGRRRPLHPGRRRRRTNPPRRPGSPGARPAVGADPAAVGLRDYRRADVTNPTRPRAAAGGGPDRRAETAEDGRDAPARPRAAGHRQDPTVEPRGVPPHPGRGRDRRPRRLQRPHPPPASRLPGHQDPRRVRPRRLLGPEGHLRLPRLPGMDPGRGEPLPDRTRPAPARATCWSPSASAAVDAGHRVRYFTAAELVDTLYRGLADNSVGKVIDTLLRNDLIIVDELGFAPLDDTGAQLLFRFVAAAYERRSLGIGSHWPFEAWGPLRWPRTHHRRLHARQAPPPLPCRHHRRRQLHHETSPSQKEEPDQQSVERTKKWGLSPGHQQRPRTGH